MGRVPTRIDERALHMQNRRRRSAAEGVRGRNYFPQVVTPQGGRRIFNEFCLRRPSGLRPKILFCPVRCPPPVRRDCFRCPVLFVFLRCGGPNPKNSAGGLWPARDSWPEICVFVVFLLSGAPPIFCCFWRSQIDFQNHRSGALAIVVDALGGGERSRRSGDRVCSSH